MYAETVLSTIKMLIYCFCMNKTIAVAQLIHITLLQKCCTNDKHLHVNGAEYFITYAMSCKSAPTYTNAFSRNVTALLLAPMSCFSFCLTRGSHIITWLLAMHCFA